ncbi:B-cell lymphoma 6 protein homolog [Ptychodera flava]|uniref:B-cell lymphoma 6 protein homolog n=1 Tax=Ptychodera flava TaxID=63121 RepID=UPI00396A084A
MCDEFRQTPRNTDAVESEGHWCARPREENVMCAGSGIEPADVTVRPAMDYNTPTSFITKQDGHISDDADDDYNAYNDLNDADDDNNEVGHPERNENGHSLPENISGISATGFNMISDSPVSRTSEPNESGLHGTSGGTECYIPQIKVEFDSDNVESGDQDRESEAEPERMYTDRARSVECENGFLVDQGMPTLQCEAGYVAGATITNNGLTFDNGNYRIEHIIREDSGLLKDEQLFEDTDDVEEDGIEYSSILVASEEMKSEHFPQESESEGDALEEFPDLEISGSTSSNDLTNPLHHGIHQTLRVSLHDVYREHNVGNSSKSKRGNKPRKNGKRSRKITALTCDICHRRFAEPRNVMRHKLAMHQKDSQKPTPCEMCGDEFLNLRDLHLHKLDSHEGDGLSASEKDQLERCRCPTCGVIFSNFANLKRHERSCVQRREREKTSTTGRGNVTSDNSEGTFNLSGSVISNIPEDTAYVDGAIMSRANSSLISNEDSEVMASSSATPIRVKDVDGQAHSRTASNLRNLVDLLQRKDKK